MNLHAEAQEPHKGGALPHRRRDEQAGILRVRRADNIEGKRSRESHIVVWCLDGGGLPFPSSTLQLGAHRTPCSSLGYNPTHPASVWPLPSAQQWSSLVKEKAIEGQF